VFAEYNVSGAMAAQDFIKNVSATFTGASAQVISGPQPKFIIKGIRPRRAPRDLQKHTYLRCLWKSYGATGASDCGSFYLRPREMWEHILIDHLEAKKQEDGKFDLLSTAYRPLVCTWGGCRKFTTPTNSLFEIGMHVKTHLPEGDTKLAHQQSKYNRRGEDAMEVSSKLFYNTATDENGDAAGIPLTAALVLRNLARNLPKDDLEDDSEAGEPHGLVRKIFAPIQQQLWFVMGYNKPLAPYMADLNCTIAGLR
jgi:chromatin structure-remodeling complex subunit RSC9